MRFLTLLTIDLGALAQPQNPWRAAIDLDLAGKYGEARVLFQKAIDTGVDPRAKANAQRARAVS